MEPNYCHVSNQLISLASREEIDDVLIPQIIKVSNQLISLASREYTIGVLIKG